MKKYFRRSLIPVFLIALVFCLVFSSNVCAQQSILEPDEVYINSIVEDILSTRRPETGLSPSHFGHPGYDHLAFTYDKAVDALVLKAAGRQKDAENILDYFASKLTLSQEDILKKRDLNNVFGILKVYQSKDKVLLAVLNAVDIKNTLPQGRGIYEFSTTPGPQSFLIFAFLAVNPTKYYPYAVELGEVLLSMQNKNGGIRDGDRSVGRVHTEPHMDSYAAFLMLYSMDNNRKWFTAAEKSYRWFEKEVFHPQQGTIDQGIWEGARQDIFATDVYSWTMCGPAGDRIPLDTLRKLTQKMLSTCLVEITVHLPNDSLQKVILSDFSSPLDPRVQRVRKGGHPLGSIEWTGGVILALQKNAVRCWNKNDLENARLYKAIAERLFRETMKCFYVVDLLPGRMSFYATGQGVEIAPFGAISDQFDWGWKTPYFFVRNENEVTTVWGASSVAAWPLLPYFGLNPFILNDDYKKTYNLIKCSQDDFALADAQMRKWVADKIYQEEIPKVVPKQSMQIVEPRFFNQLMWEAIKKADEAKDQEKLTEAGFYYLEAIQWAYRILDEKKWVQLAKEQNTAKSKALGGLVSYSWGSIYENNDYPAHYAIWKYPLLNEVGAAMWGLVNCYNEIGETQEAEKWIKRIIQDVPLHQIAVTDITADKKENIIGYWNALESWESENGIARDENIQKLFRKALKEMGLKSALPKYIIIPQESSVRPVQKT